MTCVPECLSSDIFACVDTRLCPKCDNPIVVTNMAIRYLIDPQLSLGYAIFGGPRDLYRSETEEAYCGNCCEMMYMEQTRFYCKINY